MPFAGLGNAEKTLAVAALKNAGFGTKIYPLQLRGRDTDTTTLLDKGALHITASKDVPLATNVQVTEVVPGDEFNGSEWTKVVRVTPMGTTEDIDYKFEFYVTGQLYGNTIYGVTHETRLNNHPVYKTGALDEVDATSTRFITIQGDNYTAKRKIDLGFDESYKYNVMKNYQILTAEFDIEKDKTSNSDRYPESVWGDYFDNQHLLKPQQATFHAEVWTDYSSSNTSDYMLGGVWLLVPEDLQDTEAYDFGGFVRGENPLGAGKINEIEGTATYKGSAAGLYTSLDNNVMKISRLLGKATLTANFLDGTKYGTVDGSIHDLTLDGNSVDGSLFINADLDVNHANYGATGGGTEYGTRATMKEVSIGNIQGINYTGSWGLVFQIPGETDAVIPGGVVGTIGGTGTNGNTVVATFGAYKAMPEE